MEKKNKKNTKTFDAIKVMRQIRDQLSLEIMNMSFEEERAYLDKLLSEEKKVKWLVPKKLNHLGDSHTTQLNFSSKLIPISIIKK